MEEQWLRMGKAAEVLHGREHCVPDADSTHTQLLQVPHGQDRRKSLRTKDIRTLLHSLTAKKPNSRVNGSIKPLCIHPYVVGA